MVMLKKLQIIGEKLEPTRTDVWECQMLYKYVNHDLGDPYTEAYLLENFSNPYKSFVGLTSRLYNEAMKRF